MANYFTTYWSNKTWKRERELGDKYLQHTAGNGFRKRNVQARDLLYVVSVINGELYLAARMEVQGIYPFKEAARLLSNPNLWKAKEHLIAIKGTGTALHFDVKVPLSSVRNLRLVTKKGTRPPRIKGGDVDRQTFRTIRRLTPDSASLLDALLGSHMPSQIGTELRADEADDEYEPGAVDSRRVIERQIRERRGQTEFRSKLMEGHGHRCMISKCAIADVLEAAHIKPYRGAPDHHAANGLLLRADLHTLFDLGLIGIAPKTLRVHVHATLLHSEYGEFDGVKLRCGRLRPARTALEFRWREFKPATLLR